MPTGMFAHVCHKKALRGRFGGKYGRSVGSGAEAFFGYSGHGVCTGHVLPLALLMRLFMAFLIPLLTGVSFDLAASL